MNRVCVIGDSHVAALKKGWELIQPRYDGFELTFFAAPAHLAVDLDVADGRLVTSNEKLRQFLKLTSGGRTEIGPDYDRIILCGFGLSLARLVAVYNREARVTEIMTVDEKLKSVSAEEFLALGRNQIYYTLAFQIVAKLKKITQAPIFVVTNPMPGATGREEFWGKLERNGDAPHIVEAFLTVCERVCRETGTTFVPQPMKTRRDGIKTRRRYTLNAVRLTAGNNDDGQHMNAAYGAIVLAAALDAEPA